MAVKKDKLIPMFTDSDIDNTVNDFAEKKRRNAVKVMQFVGETFVNYARNRRTYHDVTGNLRSSIGYVVATNSKVEANNFAGTGEGQSEGKGLAYNLKNGKGVVLVGVAGMEYASEVESRGLDVITGAQKQAEKVFKRLIVTI